MDDFIAHWKLVNYQLGPLGPLTVLGEFALSDLIALRETLASGPVEVEAAKIQERLAAAAIIPLRAALHERMKRFNQWVRADFAGTLWERLLSRVPKLISGWDAFLQPMRSAMWQWQKLVARVPGAQVSGMLGADGYTHARFVDDYERLEAAWESHIDAQVDLGLARAAWQITEECALAAMKAYGHAVKGRLGDGSHLVVSLPQLWPGPARGSRRGAKAFGNAG